MGMGARRVGLTAAMAVLPWLGAGEARAANGAYAVDAADISEVGSCKLESWLSAATNTDFSAVANPSCVVDPFKPVEPRQERRRMEHLDPAQGQDELHSDRHRKARRLLLCGRLVRRDDRREPRCVC